MNKQGQEYKVNIDSDFGKRLGFTSERFEKCSYISGIGKDLILSAVFDKLKIKERERIIRKLFMYNHNLLIPTKELRKLIQSIFNKGFNCIVPEFIYYDDLLKDLGFAKLYTNEDPFYNGYTALWVKKKPECIENKPLRSNAIKVSNMKNIQVLRYYTLKVLELDKIYLVDWFLKGRDAIKLNEIGDLFEIPENLIKIRLNHLKRKGFVIFDKKIKAYKSAPTKRMEDFPGANIVEYCRKKINLDIVILISHFYKKKAKLEAILNVPDPYKKVDIIWD